MHIVHDLTPELYQEICTRSEPSMSFGSELAVNLVPPCAEFGKDVCLMHHLRAPV